MVGAAQLGGDSDAAHELAHHVLVHLDAQAGPAGTRNEPSFATGSGCAGGGPIRRNQPDPGAWIR